MTIKKYFKSETQICGDCKGEGQLWSELEPHRHGSSGNMEIVTCSTCAGTGRVKVTRDVTITIEPHIQSGFIF